MSDREWWRWCWFWVKIVGRLHSFFHSQPPFIRAVKERAPIEARKTFTALNNKITSVVYMLMLIVSGIWEHGAVVCRPNDQIRKKNTKPSVLKQWNPIPYNTFSLRNIYFYSYPPSIPTVRQNEKWNKFVGRMAFRLPFRPRSMGFWFLFSSVSFALALGAKPIRRRWRMRACVRMDWSEISLW